MNLGQWNSRDSLALDSGMLDRLLTYLCIVVPVAVVMVVVAVLVLVIIVSLCMSLPCWCAPI